MAYDDINFIIFLHYIELDLDGVELVSAWMAEYVPVIVLYYIIEQIALDDEYSGGNTTLISMFSKLMSYPETNDPKVVLTLKKYVVPWFTTAIKGFVEINKPFI